MATIAAMTTTITGSLDAALQMAPLFDVLPDVYLFIKDRDSRFLHANASLLPVLGMKENADLIGKSDADFFTSDLVEQYVEEDRRVMASGRPIIDQVQIVPRTDGRIDWYITSKCPLRGEGDEIAGIAGVMRNYEQDANNREPYQEMRDVVSHILAHYHEKITTARLADRLYLSPSQFNRRFRRTFGMSPQQFVAKVRINAARQLLVSTDLSVTEIAYRTGFYDHSYFTKQFTRHMKITPLAYRKKYARGLSDSPRGMTPPPAA